MDKAACHTRLHFITSLFHSGAERLRFYTRFSTLAQENAIFVNANRSENDSHSGFFLWTKKSPRWSGIWVYIPIRSRINLRESEQNFLLTLLINKNQLSQKRWLG